MLDSSALIEVMGGSEKGKAVINLVKDEPISITSFSLYEVLKGIKDNETDKIEGISVIDVLDFDKKSAKKSIEIEKKLIRDGNLINKIDIFISAICITNSIALITLDQDFKKIKELNFIIV